jgi:hypothetical protein
MRWKPRGEWQPSIPSDPTAVSPTLRPSVPTWAMRVGPLPETHELEPSLRHSTLLWKEVQRSEPPGVPERREE